MNFKKKTNALKLENKFFGEATGAVCLPVCHKISAAMVQKSQRQGPDSPYALMPLNRNAQLKDTSLKVRVLGKVQNLYLLLNLYRFYLRHLYCPLLSPNILNYCNNSCCFWPLGGSMFHIYQSILTALPNNVFALGIAKMSKVSVTF